MNYRFLFPEKVEQFGLWLHARYKDGLERKSSPQSIVRDLLTDFSKSGWVPEWCLAYFIVEAQIETNTLIEELRDKMLGHIENGDLDRNWVSDTFKVTIGKMTEDDQNQLRNQLRTFPLYTFKRPPLQTLRRGDYCAIRLANNSYGIVIVVKMLNKSYGIIQFDEAIYEKPPVSEEIIRIKPAFMRFPAVNKVVESPFVSTHLQLARTGYWKTGHLQNNLCDQLPVFASDEGITIMYPDAIQRRLCYLHKIPVSESIYTGANPYIQTCRACGRNLRPKDNFGWSPL